MIKYILYPHQGDENDYRLTIEKAHRHTKKDVQIREVDLLLIYYIALGFNNDQAGARVGRSYSTVGHHLCTLHTDTGFANHGGIVTFGYKFGLYEWQGDEFVQLWRRATPEEVAAWKEAGNCKP